ncbi:hypothetical protein ACNQUF_12110, partial [Corynebacterium diphtheriae]
VDGSLEGGRASGAVIFPRVRARARTRTGPSPAPVSRDELPARWEYHQMSLPSAIADLYRRYARFDGHPTRPQF